MRGLAVVGGLTAVVAVGACLPASRDNPNDPAVRPAAQLQVVSDPSVAPPCANGGSTWSPISLASRGACLGLDARATTDPTGAKIVRYDYFVLESNGVAVPLVLGSDYRPIRSDGSLVQLTRAFATTRFPIPSPADLRLFTFQVEATDANGHGDTASSQVVLGNSRPTAVGNPPRTFPSGGFPWAPGQSFPVTFDGGRSHDPDGDPLTYCWRFSDNYPTTCVTDPVHSITRPMSPTVSGGGFLGESDSVLAVLDVSDGTLTSPTVPVLARVGDPVIWSANGWTQGISVSSLDTERTAPDPLLTGFGYALIAPTNGNPQVVVHVAFSQAQGQLTHLSLLSWPPPVTLLDGSQTLPYAFGNIAHRPGEPRIWVWNDQGPATSTASQLSSFDISQTGSALVAHPPVAITLPLVPFCPTLEDCGTTLAEDDLGQLWLGMTNTSAFVLAQSSANGTATVQYGNLGAHASPRAIRWRNGAQSATPGVDEVWVVEEAAFGAQGNAALVVYDVTNPTTPSHVFPLPVGKARSMSFSGPDQFWLLLPDQGIVLVDAFLLEQGYDFTAATIVNVPLASGVSLFTTVADGSLWVTTSDPELLHIQKDGTVIDLGPGVGAYFGDPTEALLFNAFPAQTAGFRGLSPAPSGAWTHAPKTATAGGYPSAAPDGSVYMLVPSESDISHYSLEGSLEEEVTQVSLTPDGATPIPLPPILPAVVSPDGAWLWTLEGTPGGNHTGVFRYSLANPSLPARNPPLALVPGPIADAIAGEGSTILPSAPVTGEPLFAWTVYGNALAGGGTVAVITTDGSPIATRFVLAKAEAPRFPNPFLPSMLSRRPYALDRSETTNDLCLATVTTSGTLTVRWITPFGVPPPPPTFTQSVGASALLSGVSVGRSASGNQACWVSTTLPGPNCPGVTLSGAQTAPTGTSTLFELDSAANLVRSATGISGVSNGVRALTPDLAWLSIYRCSPSFDDDRLKLPWTGATLDSAGEIDLPPGASRGFLGP